MIKKLKAAIARKCRQLANKWGPQERFDPSAIRLIDGGTLSLQKFRACQEFDPRDWEAREKFFGVDRWTEEARDKVRQVIAPALVDELERRGMVVFDELGRYDGKVEIRATISLYLKA